MKNKTIAVVGADKLTIKEVYLISAATAWFLNKGARVVTTDAPGGDEVVLIICKKSQRPHLVIKNTGKALDKLVAASKAALIIGSGYRADSIAKKYEKSKKNYKWIMDAS